MTTFLALIIAVVIGYNIGYVQAHHTVATECERLGKFYVGTRIFECTKITETVKTK